MKTDNQVQSRRFEYLTQTRVPALIMRLSVPTIISMLVTAIYNAADTFFVGKISTEATAAVGLTFSAMTVIQALGFFFGQGSGNYLSRMLGAQRHTDAEQMAATGLALSIITGIVTATVAVIFLKPLCLFLGAKGAMLEQTEGYLGIIVLGAPFMMAQFVLNVQLRFQGSASYAMVGLLFGAALNIVLDPLLIIVFDMGIKGAAIATVSGQIISFFVLFAGSFRGVNIRIRIKNIRFNFHYFREIINGGIPTLFRQGLAAIATVLLNRTAASYGEAVIAGMSITTRVSMFVSSALIGFGQGYQPVCAFNYGAKKLKRVREGYFFCVLYGTIFLFVMSVLCLLFAPQIISFFRDDKAVVAVGAVALRWQAAALPLVPSIVITNMMLQSIGNGLKASVTASARNGLFFIPLILILPRLFGLFGIEITQAVADILSVSVSIPLAVSELKKMKAES